MKRRNADTSKRRNGFMPDGAHSEIEAPDLTRAIMGRLGYMRAAPAVSRRRRWQRRLQRLALVAVATAVGTIGYMALKSSPEARRPLEATIPSAISTDLQHHQRQMNSVIQLLRDLPPLPALESDTGEPDRPVPGPYFDDEVENSAVAPVRWV